MTTRGHSVPLPCRILAGLLVVILALPPRILANPQGAQVRQGQVRIDATSGQLRIHQQSQRAVIDWESFSIDRGEVTRFLQPNASAAALNRVRGTSSSRIEGMLRANGNVYLINPNGILIGPSGTIDVGGFVASTLDTSDDDFMRGGDLRFSGNADAAIINLGSISALDGDVVLMAGSVLNGGTIRAPRGTAALAAGNDILLAESGEERVFVRGSGGSRKAEGVTNTGEIEANIADLKAHGGNIYGMAVKNEGRVAATGVTRSGGQIFLSAGGGKVRSTGSLRAKKSDGSGGRVKVDSGTTGKTEIGGTIDASGENGAGGEIVILGNEIEVFDGTLILNDGETSGGRTYIGGGRHGADATLANAAHLSIGSGSLISANARGTGDGGEIVLFATDTASVHGLVSAQGGAFGGDGGFIELSGQGRLYVPDLVGQVRLSAPFGDSGSLLLDPANINVTHGTGGGILGTTMTDGALMDVLANFPVLIWTSDYGVGGDGDITFAADVNLTWSSPHSLTFQADRDMIFLGGARISATGSGSFTATAERSVILGNAASISTASGALTLSGNAGATTTGQFRGIHLQNNSNVSSGTGTISLTGRGGNSILTGNHGIDVETSAAISSLGGNVFLDGRAGTTTGAAPTQEGVLIKGNITSIGNGNITINGTGGNGTSGNLGVHLFDNVLISTVDGNISITGVSGTGTNSPGIQVADFGSSTTIITSTTGDIALSGDAGSGPSEAITIFGSGASIGGGSGAVEFNATGDLRVSSNASITATGAGTVSLNATRRIAIQGGAAVTGVDGDLTFSANQGGTALGSFSGITLDSALIQSNGTGSISLTGRGGDTGNDQHGVILRNGADILGGTGGLVSVIGYGGSSNGTNHQGIFLTGTGTSISSSGADVDLAGTGGAGSLSSGININQASVTAGDAGNLTLHGIGGATTNGAFLHGVYLYEAFLNTAGGNVSVTGQAGSGSSASGDYTGVHLDYTTISSGGAGSVTVAGTAGTAVLSQTLIGVDVRFDSQIGSSGGNVIVTGIGGATSNPGIGNGAGVRLIADGTITAGGSGTVSVTGTGGNGTSIGHEGIAINGSGFESNLARIGAGDGATTITAIAGNTASHALVLGTSNAGRITSGTNNAITINADSINVGSAGIISSGSANTTILTRTGGTRIDLGGNDVLTGGPLTLGLTDAELDRITAGNLQIGNGNSGAMTVSDAISHGNHLFLTTGAGVTINNAVTMAANKNFTTNAVGTINFATANADLSTSGTGAVSLTTLRNISLSSSSSITTTVGNLTLSANADGTTSGLFDGVLVANGASLNSITGTISVTGRGGDTINAGNHGIRLDGTSTITSLGGNIVLTGQARGSAGSNPTQEGIIVAGNVTTIGSGTITLHGTGGNATSGNIGVHVLDDVLVSTENGAISITGVSGPGTNSPGIQLADFGGTPTVITTTGGTITLTGDGSAGSSPGINVFGSGVSIGGGTGHVELTASGDLSLTSNATIGATGAGTVVLTATRSISMASGAGISAVDGAISLTANRGPYPAYGSLIGMDLDGATVATTGTGSITLSGHGGDATADQNGIRLRGGTSLATNGGDLTLLGESTDPLSSGIRIDLASLTSGGGVLELEGTGGNVSIDSPDTNATIGAPGDTVIVKSTSGGVGIFSRVRAYRLQLQDLGGADAMDFTLNNANNDVDQFNTLGNGPNGRIGTLVFREANGFRITDFLGGDGIAASGFLDMQATRFSGSSIVIDAPVSSQGGNITIAGRDVVVDGTEITTLGEGGLELDAGRAILVQGDSLLSVTDGELSVSAHQDEFYTTGTFTGLTILGSRVQSLGTGGISLYGKGGNGGTGSDFSYSGFTNASTNGVRLDGGTVIASSHPSSSDFTVKIVGEGGLGASDSVGVVIATPDTIVSAASGTLLIEGFGAGQSTGQRNRGILFTGGHIQATNQGNITLYGVGGSGVNENDGIQLNSGARISAANGDMILDGYAGETLGIGVILGNTAGNLSITGTGTVTVQGEGSNADAVVLGNAGALVGGTNAGFVELKSTGNLRVQRELLASGGIFLNASAGSTFVDGEIHSSNGDIAIEGDDVTINAAVNADDGNIEVIFGDHPVIGESSPEVEAATFNGTAAINDLLTASGWVRYYGGDGGGDLLTFAGYTLSEIDLAFGSLFDVEQVVGTGSSDDRLTGPSVASSYSFTGADVFQVGGVDFSAFENVVGGAANDTFAFSGSATLSGSLDGGGGTNTLDYTSYGTGVIIDLENGAATGIIGGFENIATFTGSGNIDTITGPGSASTYTFTGPDAMQVGSVSVSGFENVVAGPLEDEFIFLPGSRISGTLDGGSSPNPVVNRLNYAGYGAPVTIQLGTTPLSATGIAGGFSNVNQFIGSALATDRFIGPQTGTTYQITGANAFSSGAFTASGFENLTGGIGSDTFAFGPGAALGGRLSGGTSPGTDTLDYSAFGRAVTVNIGPNTATGIGGGFIDLERIIGSAGNDRFNFLNQATISFVDGGGGTDLLEINDSTLRGENTYNITSNSVSRNPLYTFNNFEALRLFLGTGNNTVNSDFFGYTQFIHGGAGYNTLNLPGISSLNQGNPIRNVYHYGIDAPRPDGNDTGGLLQLEVNQQNQGPNTGQGFNTENRFSIVDPGTLSQQIGALSGAFAAAVTAQASLIVVDGNPYLVFRPFSLDGSGITPSNLAIGALNESLGVDANLELAAAIGYTGPLFLFNPDGPLGLDLSGAPIDPAILTVLQESLAIAAASELSAAIGLNLVVSIVPTDGISPIALDGSAPGQSIVLLLSEQLGDPAQNELQAAIGTN